MLNMDFDILCEVIIEDICMILGVSILGNFVVLDVMWEVVDENGLYFMEDNCEFMDVELNGKKVGIFGDFNIFSFFFFYYILIMEGGMILIDDDELNEVCCSLRVYGWIRDLLVDFFLFDKKEDDFFEVYCFILFGYNVRLIELNVVVGIE